MYIIQLSFESGLTEHRKKALIFSLLVLNNMCLNSVSLLYKVLTTVLGRRGGRFQTSPGPFFSILRLSLSLRWSPHSLLYSALLSCPLFTRSHLSSPVHSSALTSSALLFFTLSLLSSVVVLSFRFLSFRFLSFPAFFFPILGLVLVCKVRDISLQRTTLMRLEPVLTYRDLPLKNLTSLIMLAKHTQ